MRLHDTARAADDELLARTARDPEAFGVFYDRYEAQVLGFFWRATQRADVAADLTAEVFAAALESASSYRPQSGSARSWLFGIARHALADTWESGRVEDRARRRLALPPLTLTDEALERVEEIASRASLDVLELLQSLPDDQRAAVQGRVVDGLGYPELAVSLRCSQSLVRQRVSRGLRALRARLGEESA